MREFVVNNSLNLIKKNYPDYSDEQMEILEYGLTGLYIFITKTIIIFSVAYFLGVLKELVIFMLIYNSIRSVSFGVHATSSLKCLFFSAISFISATYICKIYILPFLFKLIAGIFGIIYILIYSPADTEKKPIVSSKRRLIYKILSTVIAIIMVIFSFIINSDFIANSCTIALLIQCVMISPITYKLTNQRYDNYKYFKYD